MDYQKTCAFLHGWQTGHLLLIYMFNLHVLSHLLLIYICKLHMNLNMMFSMDGKQVI